MAKTPVGGVRTWAVADGNDGDVHVRRRGYDRDRFKQIRHDLDKPSAPTPRQGLMPTRVDMRPDCPPIYDQGDLGACTAFTLAKGLREIVQKRRGGKEVPQSALFFYYQERAIAGTTNLDAGATLADGIKVLTHVGSAPEAYWPYVEAKFNVKPASQAFAEAGKWKLRKAYHLQGLADVKTSLARGYTVAMGFETFNTFDAAGSGNGKMAMPTAKAKPLGGHAALAVGYDDKAGHLIMRNSFGAKWGDKGYFYMPYKYAANPDYVDECWTAGD